MKRDITIQTNDGPITVSANVKNHLAIHKSDAWRKTWKRTGRRWRITHVPSGMALGTSYDSSTLRGARTIRDALLALDVDWSQPRPDLRIGKATKERIVAIVREAK